MLMDKILNSPLDITATGAINAPLKLVQKMFKNRKAVPLWNRTVIEALIFSICVQ